MKRSYLFIFCLIQYFANAQSTAYKGTINVGSNQLEVIFKFNNAQSFNPATLDVLAQGAFGIKCDESYRRNDSLFISISMINGSFRGAILNDSTIQGTWKQMLDFPLTLIRTKDLTQFERPQHPKPTEEYQSRNVNYYNKDNSVYFGATITSPKAVGKHPAIILINGSGQQNRDSEIFGHKPFAVLADFFSRNGFVVLRADDRGIGETKGDIQDATTADFANDVKTHVAYLKKQDDVDKSKIILIGHSEGGMIAPIVAVDMKEIYALILLAAPGIPIVDLLMEQQGAVLLSQKIPKNDVDPFLYYFKQMTLASSTAGDPPSAKNQMKQILDDYLESTSSATAALITGVTDENSKQAYINEMHAAFSSRWFDFFIRYIPDENLSKLSCPVLAINGSNDIQVIAESNLAGIESSLKKSKSKFKIIEVDGLNHLFQKCNACDVAEYGELNETFSPEVMQMMLGWLKAIENK